VSDNPTVLVDRVRAAQFALLGSARPRSLFDDYDTWADDEGVVWAGARFGGHGVAVTWLGGGWAFDPYAAERRRKELAARRAEMREADGKTHALELACVLDRLTLNGRGERLLWLIHRTVMAGRTSAFRLPDYTLARAVWGKGKPPHWRSDLLASLQSLSRLHAADWPADGFPLLGRDTALLTHVADLRGEPAADACDPDCPGRLGPRHHHFLLNVGRGFLGVLEQFVTAEDESGVRSYDFPTGGPKSEGPALWKVGKSGRLVSMFLPAKLGDPAACANYCDRQHRLLQALVRETTRAKKKHRRVIGEAEVITGNLVKAFHGVKRVACPILDPAGRYVGFNGNRKFREKGYKFASTVGWLVKAGYPLDKPDALLDDLAGLEGPLGLVVVGVGRGSQFYTLTEMRGLAMTPKGRRTLELLHVRVFTAPDYLERWTEVFGGDRRCVENEPHGTDADAVAALLVAMKVEKISRRELAKGVGADTSFLSKILNGKKPWPKGMLEKIQKWLAARNSPKGANSRPFRCALGRKQSKEVSILDEALRLLGKGWSVVPQIPGEKKPRVRWKPYQERLPTEEELTRWFEQWPDAGLALVLGPVSGVFVIDVDGEEAHDALVKRLGKEPVAPKALSGSGKPHRYHLYFRCPDVPTRAKQTPWHPSLEFRGQGGIVVIPPSLHKSGNRYVWGNRSSDFTEIVASAHEQT
jgi:Bifunctional DNA primase/polymerase, N-terminal